jgi:hypothetical protein
MSSRRPAHGSALSLVERSLAHSRPRQGILAMLFTAGGLSTRRPRPLQCYKLPCPLRQRPSAEPPVLSGLAHALSRPPLHATPAAASPALTSIPGEVNSPSSNMHARTRIHALSPSLRAPPRIPASHSSVAEHRAQFTPFSTPRLSAVAYLQMPSLPTTPPLIPPLSHHSATTLPRHGPSSLKAAIYLCPIPPPLPVPHRPIPPSWDILHCWPANPLHSHPAPLPLLRLRLARPP